MTIQALNQNKINKTINSAQTAKTGIQVLDQLKSNSGIQRIEGIAQIAQAIAAAMA